jgi:hypothetical protein
VTPAAIKRVLFAWNKEASISLYNHLRLRSQFIIFTAFYLYITLPCLSLYILIDPPLGRQFIIKQLSNTIIAPNIRPRAGPSTASNMPIKAGIDTPGSEPLSMTLPEKIEAARRHITELEE